MTKKSKAKPVRRIRVWIDTGFAGAKHEDFEELPDYWDTMTELEQNEYLDDVVDCFMSRRIDCGACVEEI